MRVGSLFSGMGGIDLAFERAGATVAWNCEIDPKCRAVLRKHWPGIPRFKDVKTVTAKGLGTAGLAVDAVVGGFPCQDVSIAGARAGLAGERSGLFFEFARLLDELRPAWCLVENVPGLLSSHGGADMGAVVGTLVDLGYGVAWRVLDAQYFGVAQRRHRVFVVGCLGDRARAEQVLLVGEGGGGDPPARRAAGSLAAAGAGGCVAGDGELVTGLPGSFGNGGADDNKAQAGWLVPAVSHALCAPSTGGAHNDHNGETPLPVAFRKARKIHGPLASAPDEERWEETEVTDTFTERDGSAPTTLTVSFQERKRDDGRNLEAIEEQAYALTSPNGGGRGHERNILTPDLAVRRLTPLECLRLQGFPDDWLDGLGLADSVKYRMVGNAVAMPVVEWIARRMVEAHRAG